MEHYKQQMKDKIKEGVAAFSERGSEGKYCILICLNKTNFHLIIINKFRHFFLLRPGSLLKIIFGEFGPGGFIQILQIKYQALVHAISKINEEFLNQLRHAVHLSVVLAVELGVACMRPMLVIIVVVIITLQNKEKIVWCQFAREDVKMKMGLFHAKYVITKHGMYG